MKWKVIECDDDSTENGIKEIWAEKKTVLCNSAINLIFSTLFACLCCCDLILSVLTSWWNFADRIAHSYLFNGCIIQTNWLGLASSAIELRTYSQNYERKSRERKKNRNKNDWQHAGVAQSTQSHSHQSFGVVHTNGIAEQKSSKNIKTDLISTAQLENDRRIVYTKRYMCDMYAVLRTYSLFERLISFAMKRARKKQKNNHIDDSSWALSSPNGCIDKLEAITKAHIFLVFFSLFSSSSSFIHFWRWNFAFSFHKFEHIFGRMATVKCDCNPIHVRQQRLHTICEIAFDVYCYYMYLLAGWLLDVGKR